ncbi:zf-TFIIB domain-containing protein [Pseudoduganella sp. GCM10020061]|uniref:TFIIB-type zinc ribbon-containing protein n=1 Tax=Pseudoduganella sp. GCM10020061 TaxID=3317345 RepID=UPI00362868E9
MECPVCKNVQLLMSDRQGIEIDYCPNCRGVWLDRGELDKIIERSMGQPAAAPAAAAPAPGTGWGHTPPPQTPYPQHQQAQHQPPQHQHGYPHPHHGYHKKKKREGFLGELFDFD